MSAGLSQPQQSSDPLSPSSLDSALSSPAHIAVLLSEAVDALDVKSDGIYVDATFGRGGHSREILTRLGISGRLIALDRDLDAVAAAAAIQDARFQIVHSRFAALADVLNEIGVQQVDGVLLDLGISSPQVDQGARGFSFRFDGPLDMRMDQSRGQTAAQFIAQASERQLTGVIREYGEERFAKQIARAIVAARDAGSAIATTGQLAKIVARATPKIEPGFDPATRTFQALRIFVNQELEELALVLPQCLSVLRAGGRLAVISFHSLEDRIVKRFIRSEQNRDDLPANFPVRAQDLPQPRMVAVGRAVRPGAAEVRRNPRARSAVLRVAERTAVA